MSFRSLACLALVAVPVLAACGSDASLPVTDLDAGALPVDAGEPAPDAGPPACDVGERCGGSGACIDTKTDPKNCGSCGNACEQVNGTTACSLGQCALPCAAGAFDCDGDLANGCEAREACLCVPGSKLGCYGGAAGTLDVGICKAGQKTCAATGLAFGPCEGEVVPRAEVCEEAGLDENCDGQSNEGGDGCDCVPGKTEACWEGPANAKFGGTSVCKQGTRTCLGSGKWGACANQVLPQVESAAVCTPSIDEDCDGDPLGLAGKDQDGDGWTVCGGDCCDSTESCSLPKAVNPGAYDVSGNNLDDDCDGTKDNVVTSCDSGLASNSASPLDYARALDLCQNTTESPADVRQKKWGVISAQLTLADGTGVPNPSSRSIRPRFGNAILPKKGANLVVLSTGNAADATATNPAYAPFQNGQDMGTSSGFPADWLARNNNLLPNAPGCPSITSGSTANDPVMLKLRVRVPTNAKSFSVNSYFMSAEYPEWVCSAYNDFFVTLLDSAFNGLPANPSDKNLSFVQAGNGRTPVGTNLAYLDNGLFPVCQNNRVMACAYGNNKTIRTCNLGSGQLSGTGFDPVVNVSSSGEGCQVGDIVGGGTSYMTAVGNVVPGETIEVRFAIWDTSDHAWDSLVLLDNWTWSLIAAQPGTVGGN